MLIDSPADVENSGSSGWLLSGGLLCRARERMAREYVGVYSGAYFSENFTVNWEGVYATNDREGRFVYLMKADYTLL